MLNFLKYPQNEFDNYWYESSRLPSVLINYIKKHSLCTPDAYGREQSISIVELDSSSDSGEVNDLALLFQIGYLSIKKAMPKDKVVVLNYPNSKVASSMARIYVDKFVKGKSWLNLYTEFMEHTPEQIVDFLNNSALTPRIVSLIDETYESTTRNDYTHLMQGGLVPCIKECYTNTVENPMINDLTVENEIVDIMNFKRYDLEKEIYKFGVNVGNYKDKDIGITNPYNKSTIIVKENGSKEN